MSRGDEQPSHDNAAQPGDVLDYQIDVENTGNAAAEGVAVTDDITDILAARDYNDDCNAAASDADGDVLTWTVDVPAGDSVTLTFSVTLEQRLPGWDDDPAERRRGRSARAPTARAPRADAGLRDEHRRQPVPAVDRQGATTRRRLRSSCRTTTIVQVPTANEGDTVTYTLEYHVGDLPVTDARHHRRPAGRRRVRRPAPPAATAQFTFARLRLDGPDAVLDGRSRSPRTAP